MCEQNVYMCVIEWNGGRGDTENQFLFACLEWNSTHTVTSLHCSLPAHSSILQQNLLWTQWRKLGRCCGVWNPSHGGGGEQHQGCQLHILWSLWQPHRHGASQWHCVAGRVLWRRPWEAAGKMAAGDSVVHNCGLVRLLWHDRSLLLRQGRWLLWSVSQNC